MGFSKNIGSSFSSMIEELSADNLLFSVPLRIPRLAFLCWLVISAEFKRLLLCEEVVETVDLESKSIAGLNRPLSTELLVEIFLAGLCRPSAKLLLILPAVIDVVGLPRPVIFPNNDCFLPSLPAVDFRDWEETLDFLAKLASPLVLLPATSNLDALWWWLLFFLSSAARYNFRILDWK